MAEKHWFQHCLRQLSKRATRLDAWARVRLAALVLLFVVTFRSFRRRWALGARDPRFGVASNDRKGAEVDDGARKEKLRAALGSYLVAPAAKVPPPPIARDGEYAPARQKWERQGESVGMSRSYREGVGQSYRGPCKFPVGCCAFGENCYYSHDPRSSAGNGKSYKVDYCSYFLLGWGCDKPEGMCKNAHGDEELEARVPHAPPAFFPDTGMPYSDSHCHLDGILLVRNFGHYWHFRTKVCRDYREEGRNCFYKTECYHAHEDHELKKRPVLRKEYLMDWVATLPAGFTHLVHNCCDRESIEQAVQLVQWGRELLDGRIYVTFGLHPSDFYFYTDEYEAALIDALESCGDRAVAWGECGLDFYRKPTKWERSHMRQIMVRQVKMAVARGLSLVIHSRDAEEATLEVLREHAPRDTKIHLHSYSGTVANLSQFFEEWPLCFYGANGAVTYSSAQSLVELVEFCPLERLLLETDGPFMIPEPYRFGGGGSHAGHIPWVANKIAEVKGVSAEVVLAHAQSNLCTMYDIDEADASKRV